MTEEKTFHNIVLFERGLIKLAFVGLLRSTWLQDRDGMERGSGVDKCFQFANYLILFLVTPKQFM